MRANSTEEGNSRSKLGTTAVQVLIWIGVAFLFLLNAILIIGRHGGARTAFTNAENIAFIIGILFGGVILSTIAGLAIWAIFKRAAKRQPSLLVFISVAYLAYSALNVIPPSPEKARVAIDVNRLTVNGSLQLSFKGSPKRVEDANKGMASYIWKQGNAVETMTALKITEARLRIEQQYPLMEKVLDGYQDSQPVESRSRGRLLQGTLPVIAATYKLKDLNEADRTLHVRVLMKDGWCIFLQLSCPDTDYQEYSDFIDDIRILR
jgi:hypothetical protein